jgi:hypothetical protein
VTDAVPFSVNLHDLALLATHAPEKFACRPLPTVNVIDVPTVNDADPLVPVTTLMPVGVDVMRTPLRPVAVSVTVAVCGGGAGGVTVSVAALVPV